MKRSALLFIVLAFVSPAAFGQCGTNGKQIFNPFSGTWDCTGLPGGVGVTITSPGGTIAVGGTATNPTLDTTGGGPFTCSFAGGATCTMSIPGVALSAVWACFDTSGTRVELLPDSLAGSDADTLVLNAVGATTGGCNAITGVGATGATGPAGPSGGSPGAPPLSVQTNNGAGGFSGSADFVFYPGQSPSVPVLAIVGTPGSITYGYKVVFRTPIGTSAASVEATIATGNAILDGTNYVSVTVPTCTVANTTVDVYLTTTDPGSNTPDTGFLTNILCGSTYLDQGDDGNGNPPPVADSAKGVLLSGAFVGLTGLSLPTLIGTYAPSIGVAKMFSGGAQFGAGLMVLPTLDLSADANQFEGADIEATTLFGSSHNLAVLVGINAIASHQGSGTVTAIYGVASSVATFGPALSTYGYDAPAPSVQTGLGGSIVTHYAYHAPDLTTAGVTNEYYTWFDSRGVYRIKEDNSFDSVGQAIATLYNPQFAKYTPGATDFERLVEGRWNGNVAEIGTEKGGTGTLRGLRLLGTNVFVPFVDTIPTVTSSLPSCASGTWGTRGAVTDATAPAIGVALTGGGTVFATVHCSKTTSTYFVDGL